MWLFQYASGHFYPEEFYAKVLALAKPAAVRRYVSRSGIEYVENDENLQVIDLESKH